CRLTSREKPRSNLQRSPFWLSWLLFRWWRRRWNPRLPGYRAWRDAHGQLADCEKVAVKFGFLSETVSRALVNCEGSLVCGSRAGLVSSEWLCQKCLVYDRNAGQLETPQEFRPGSSKRKEQVGGASRAHRRPLWHTCAQVRRAGLCLPRPVSLGLRRHGVPRGASQRL
ncbi:hypothetical protein EGK_14314, partial [Macaca mulatta]